MRFSDLHAHLGASTPIDIVWEISKELGIKVGTKSYETFVESMNTPNRLAHTSYLNKFPTVQSIQSSPMAVERSVYHAITHAYKKLGLSMIELRFNPILRSAGIYDLDTIILSATIGMKRAKMAYPIEAGIIIETDRTFTPEKSMILAQKAVSFKKEGVVGFDMSGRTQEGFCLRDHYRSFEMAKIGGLGITVHAGELPNTDEEVIDAIQRLCADRIGHGIQIANNEEALKIASDNKVHFEFCPTSNVMTGCCQSYDEFGLIIKRFNQFDISWNLNTDGSEFLSTTVSDEHRKVCLTPKERGRIEMYAASASFVNKLKI